MTTTPANPPAPLQIPEDDALRARIAALVAEHEAKTAQQQAAEATGIRFVFCDETTNRQIGADVWVKNRFGNTTGGTIVEKIGDGLYRVKIFDNQFVPVHEPELVWME